MSKIAILIQCHKNPEQVNLLLAALQHPDVDIYIHVDKKSDIGSRLRTSSQMHILPDKYRVDVQWATFSQVRATLHLLRYASHHGEYEHYWLCSGQDYPIKSIDEIVRFLHSKPDANFIQIWDSKNSTGGVPRTTTTNVQLSIFQHLFWETVLQRELQNVRLLS
jgi:hypothetical protein